MLAVATETGNAVTVRQYAEMTGLSLMTVYEHVWRGKVPAKQYLGRWLIFLPKVEESPDSRASA
jgi:predicted DNA-binding transcriptional regulator AlpA